MPTAAASAKPRPIRATAPHVSHAKAAAHRAPAARGDVRHERRELRAGRYDHVERRVERRERRRFQRERIEVRRAPRVTVRFTPPPLYPPGIYDAWARFAPGAQVSILWGNQWWSGVVRARANGRFLVHYTGWGNAWDEWVGPERLR